jgi:CHASE2 domain-containing sensor protein
MPPATQVSFRSSVSKSLATGLIITFIILGIKWCAEQTPLYRSIQAATYVWLQGLLTPPAKREALPIVLVDINPLKPVTRLVEGKEFSETPRDKLLELIRAVAKQHPRVIGVDIDFSPIEHGYVNFRDPKFFRDVIAISKDKEWPVPIFLGIKRSDNKPKENWLSDPEFAELAADISVPIDDNRKMFKSLRLVPTGNSPSSIGKTMSASLASALVKPRVRVATKLDRFIRESSEVALTDTLRAEAFLVDFSPLSAIRDMRLTTDDPGAIATNNWMFSDKAVLLGDGVRTTPRDQFIVPLQDETRPVPGAYLHACAAYTLAQNSLFEFTALGQLGADLLLSVAVLLCVITASIYVSRTGRLAELRTAYLFTFLVTVLALGGGVVFVAKTRVVWDDFLFVTLALLIHPLAHRGLVWSWQRLRANGPAFATRLFSKKE